jgi:hypothetical protein|mmetsp:Transcript_55984/g.93001  ORF Transcript_55984/g.93001 Transcript_55984/m.93001 type:complete len:81 (+) Transcript_55984:2191-2433(+)
MQKLTDDKLIKKGWGQHHPSMPFKDAKDGPRESQLQNGRNIHQEATQHPPHKKLPSGEGPPQIDIIMSIGRKASKRSERV